MRKKWKFATLVTEEPSNVRTRGFLFSIHSIAEVIGCSTKKIERRIKAKVFSPESLEETARFIAKEKGWTAKGILEVQKRGRKKRIKKTSGDAEPDVEQAS